MPNLLIDGKETLRDLFEEGIIRVGSRLQFKNIQRTEYKSSKSKNGVKDQTFITHNLPGIISYEIASLPEKNGILVLGDIYINNFYIGGEIGYLYGVQELNNLCNKIFSFKYLKARSMTIEDVNKILGIEVKDNKLIQNVGTSKENLLTSFKEFIFSKNSYTPESFLKQEYEKEGTKITLIDKLLFSEEQLICSVMKKSLIFKRVPYYLASQGAVSYDNVTLDYGLDIVTSIKHEHNCKVLSMFDSNGDRYFQKMGVRAVGYIDPDIPIEDLGLQNIVIPQIYAKIS